MSGTQDETRCAGMEMLLHALADGELDAANALRCETHLRGCGRCAAAFAELRDMQAVLRRGEMRFRAPERLRGRVLAMVEAAAAEAPPEAPAPAPAPGAPAWPGRPLAVAAAALRGRASALANRRWAWRSPGGLPALALAAGFAAMVLVVAPLRPGPDGDAELRRDVVAGHVRSLLVAGRLTDVVSSDRHTVKPWFAGRLDFSPPTPDLAEAGFPLAGGRLDYLDGHPVAALIYRRRDHVINVFVWPDARAGTPTAPRQVSGGAGRDGGHAVVHWTGNGMTCWAVSDLNASELADFARLFGARAQDPAPAQ